VFRDSATLVIAGTSSYMLSFISLTLCSYHVAWTLENQTSPNVGFKLAANYLKCKNFIACIDACHAVSFFMMII
jgi:hypothetical protein